YVKPLRARLKTKQVSMNEQEQAEWHDRISVAAERLGLSITDQQIEALIAYQNQLLRWNKVYNLTALRDPNKVLVQHIFDSLAVVGPLSDHFGTGRTISILDVGSGGGLP